MFKGHFKCCLKKAFIYALILAHVDPKKPIIIEADASDFALCDILSQKGDDMKLLSIHVNLIVLRLAMRYMIRSY